MQSCQVIGGFFSVNQGGIIYGKLFLFKSFELPGVEPNPRISTVRKGVKICRDNNIDVVLPVGGGSSIDCSKAIAAGYYYDKDPWDLVLNNSLITKALPLVNVSTLSATGSEMDCFAVISNEDTKEKKEICSLKIE